MSRNGLGLYTLPLDWVADRNAGIKILASRMMTQEQDIADALTASIAADGQTTITATIPMSSNKITLLASSTTRTGAANLGQIQDSSANYASASGTNTYVASLDPPITTYPDGLTAYIYFPNTNTAAATATLNLNGVSARNLIIGSAIAPVGSIKVGVGIVVARGTTFQYFPSASPSVFGLTDGGFLATGASADLNTSYMVDCSGTARTVYLNSAPATGDTMAFTILGTNNCALWASGKLAYATTSTVDSAGGEGFLMPRYTGTVRGWIW